MKKVILYIATSLDGYIADKEHRVEWLEKLENPDSNDYGYKNFLSDIDTLIMGRKTYEVIKGFGTEWPYQHCRTLVVSRHPELAIDTPNTEVFSGDLFEEVERIKNVWSDKHIWLLGGGITTRSFLEHQCIDEIMLFTAPIVLGEGIRLFPEFRKPVRLSLLENWSYPSGMVYSHYKIIKD
ncbi:dihydrofolate reductase family protein [Robertkochia flava]|uniref:dihydrofolate reductase family protein n=1 Tax=Robertkochia flava TaxID=3447986 RepID=UPI001CCFDB3C|nr:dihydrofolate reductase family protein [Robertkochia marina]